MNSFYNYAVELNDLVPSKKSIKNKKAQKRNRSFSVTLQVCINLLQSMASSK